MSSRHFILGLLTQRSMSGYDVKQSLENLCWLIGSPSFGSLYPALHSLSEDGLASMDVIHSGDKPPRKVYTITDKGRKALEEWLHQSMDSETSQKAFLMRLMLASNLSRPGLIAYLQQRHARVAEYQEALQVQEETSDLGQRLAYDYGLAIATAELAWLDRMLEKIARPALAGEGLDSI